MAAGQRALMSMTGARITRRKGERNMTKEKLESLFYLREELNMWNRIYNDRVADIAPPVKNIDGMPFSKTNGISHPVEDKAIKLAETADAIQSKIQEINQTIIEVENYILSLSDPLIRQILEYRCISNYSWSRIAIMIGGKNTEESIRQQYSRFMRRLEDAEDGD